MLLLRRLKVSWILMGSVCCYQSSQFTHVLVGGRWLLDKCWYTNPRLSFSAATTRVAVTQFHFHNSSLLTTRACCSAGSWQWLPLTKQLLLICLLRHGLGRGFCCWWTIRIHDWEYKRASSSRRGSDETRHRIHSNVTLFSTPKGNVWSCTNIPYLPLLLSWQPGRCSVFSSERSLRKESSLRKWCASSTNSSAALYSALIYWFIYWHMCPEITHLLVGLIETQKKHNSYLDDHIMKPQFGWFTVSGPHSIPKHSSSLSCCYSWNGSLQWDMRFTFKTTLLY